MSIRFEFQNTSQSKLLPSQILLKQWINATKNLCPQRSELTIRIVSEDESAQLNERYRHKRGPTNVLSFPAESIIENGYTYLGDLIVCASIVEKEAIQQHKTLNAHWAHITIHGILHLLGYDHITNQDAERMESLEIQILSTLGFPNPYLMENNE